MSSDDAARDDRRDWADLTSGLVLGSGLLVCAVLAVRPMLCGFDEPSVANALVTSLVVLLAAVVLVRTIFDHAVALPGPWVLAPLGAVVAAGALSAVLAGHAWPAQVQLVAWCSNVVFFLAVFALAATEGERGAAVRRAVVAAILATAGVMALYGIYQRFAVMPSLLDQMRADERGRELLKLPGAVGRVTNGEVFATFVTPNAYAGYLAMVLPVAAGVALWARARARRAASVAAFATVAAIVVALVLTGSAGGWAAAFAGLAALAAVLGGRRAVAWLSSKLPATPAARRGAVAAIGAVAAVLVVLAAGALFASRSMQVRTGYWKAALAMAVDNPLGVGLGNFADRYPQYKVPEGLETREAHNVYLSMLAEAGPVALIAFGVLAYGFVRTLRRRVEMAPPGEAAGVGVGVGPARLGALGLAGGVSGMLAAYAIGTVTSGGMHSEAIAAVLAGQGGRGTVVAALVHVAFVPAWAALFYVLFRADVDDARVRASLAAAVAALGVHGLVEFDFSIRTTMLVASALGAVALSTASPLVARAHGWRVVLPPLAALALVPLFLFGSTRLMRLWELGELARSEIARAERLEDAARDLPIAVSSKELDRVEEILAAADDEPAVRLRAADVREAVSRADGLRLRAAASEFGAEARREARTALSRAWDLLGEYVDVEPGDGERVAEFARLGEMVNARNIRVESRDAVERAIRRLTDRAPDSFGAWMLLARHHGSQGHLTQAAAAFEKAAERYPLDPDVLLRLGDACIFFDPPRAIAAYARALEVNRVVEDENTTLFARLWGMRPTRPGRPDQLVKLETRPDSVECVFRAALMYVEIGGFADAVARFDAALALRPGDVQLLAFRALVLRLEALRADTDEARARANAAWDEFIAAQSLAPPERRLPARLVELFGARNKALRLTARNEAW